MSHGLWAERKIISRIELLGFHSLEWPACRRVLYITTEAPFYLPRICFLLSKSGENSISCYQGAKLSVQAVRPTLRILPLEECKFSIFMIED